MQGLKHKRTIAKFLCFLMILEMFVASPNIAEASVSKTISKNGREYCAVEGNKQTITVTLASPNKPENTKVVSSSVPSWASVSKPNYNSPVFKVTVQQNNGSGSRVENIEFTDGTNTWTLTLTQYVYKAPTTKPTTKPVTKEPTKKAPTPTKAPTSTPTPMPELTASEMWLSFPAESATKTITISGYAGTLRADRGNNDTWFTVSVSGGTISVTATKNTSTARAGYVDVTDTGSGRSVRIQVTQAAPIINPGPTKAPTSTPTPVPAETLPVKTKTLNFSAQAGQDTISLDGSGYNLTFTFQDNPSIPGGWIGMVYDGDQIKVKVERNKDYNARSMKVKITDTKTNQYAYVTINQKAAPKPSPTPTPYLKTDKEAFEFDDKGGSDTITLKGVQGSIGFEFTWNTSDQKDWVHAIYDGKSVKFSVDQNKSIDPRTATLIIKDLKTNKTVSLLISQEKMPNSVNIQGPVTVQSFVVYASSIVLGMKADSDTISVVGNTGTLLFQYDWDSDSQKDWVRMIYNGSVIKYTVDENKSYFSRSATVTITDSGSGKTAKVFIKQEGDPDAEIPYCYGIYFYNGWLTAAKPDFITQTAGKPIEFPINPKRDGYTFTGWYTGFADGEKIERGTLAAVEGPRVLYAHWRGEKECRVVGYPNYENAPLPWPRVYLHEGDRFDELPKTPVRSGFEFDGWYTEPNGGTQVTKETVYTDAAMDKVYAHWKVKIHLIDFDLLKDPQYVDAQEKCIAIIPDSIIELYGMFGFNVSGWTTTKNSKVKQSISATKYQIPDNVDKPEMTLWAINDKGQTFEEYLLKKYGSVELAKAFYDIKKVSGEALSILPEKLPPTPSYLLTLYKYTKANGIVDTFNSLSDIKKRDYMDLLCRIYSNSEANYRGNVYLYSMSGVGSDLKESDGYFNGQGRGMKSALRVGEMSFKEAGCGIIACYNALNSVGRRPYLPDLVKTFETSDCLMSLPKGAKAILGDSVKEEAYRIGGLGPNPYKIDDILRKYELSTKEYTSKDSFLNTVLKAVNNGAHKKYIVAFWNNGDDLFPTAHYVFLETDPSDSAGKPLKIYNRYNTCTGAESVSIKTFRDKLTWSKNGKNLFIIGYEIVE